MPSKMVTDRQKTALSLTSAMQTFKDQLQGSLDALTARLRDGARFDISPLLDLLVLAVQDAINALSVADAENEREQGEDAQDREARDATNAALVAQLVELGDILTTLYGAAARRAVGLQGTTPRDPQAALEASKRVLGALPGLKLTPRVKGMTFDPTPYQESIQAGTQQLDAALVALSKNLRETDQTQVAKDAAMNHYHKTYLKVATLFEAFCRVADLDALADSVRRSVSRPESPIETQDVAPSSAPSSAPTSPASAP
jgi:hypothetical protein